MPVLGFSALQLSSDRDPNAPHAGARGAGAADLRALVERGLVRNLPPSLVATPPRIAAADPIARAALGYLHAQLRPLPQRRRRAVAASTWCSRSASTIRAQA